MVLSVRQKQTDAVVRALRCHQETAKGPSRATGDCGEVYKVLVLDRYCRDLLAPLMRVNDLRSHGVTLHLMLESERQPIPDVAAVYLMQATQQNVERVTKDLESKLYDQYHINFVHSAPRGILEELALGTARSGQASRVARVFDQYVSFMSLDAGLFSLGLPRSYIELNDPSAQDYHIERGVSAVVDGLFSVVVTLGVVPIIRCPKGGLAQHIAQALAEKIREHLSRRVNLFSEGSAVGLATSMSRPLLVLFDRNFELTTAVQHCWRYQPLVQDILGLHLNRVDVLTPAEPSAAKADQPQKKSYDVGEGDFFWTENGAKDFPAVAEEVEIQLGRYKKAVEAINRRAEAGEEQVDMDAELEANTKHLMSAVATLPQLTERKRVLDKHTNIATALLGQIKARNVDHFHQLEEDLLVGKVDSNQVMQTLRGSKGDVMDKLRLALMYILVAESVPSDVEMSTITEVLASAGSATKALAYVRRLRRMNLIGASSLKRGSGASVSASSQGNLLDWADKTFGQGLSAVTKGMKSLMSGARQSMVGLAVEALLEAKPGTEEDFEVLDPKLPANASPAQLAEKAKGPFRDAIVFMIGGGNYLESQTIRALGSAATTPRNIIYGATELLSPLQFVQQLAELGAKSS
mmetsp:Transcript_26619/g.63079  ORF Transcript_26619/g.63079 Transcript_26619/m.63079 type:complete len:636 (+) Transcript_26619:478-2385(+)